MKHYVVGGMLFGIMAILTFNGFQCGSAESTSAKLYISRQDWPGAEKALLKEVANNPNNPEAWFLLGDVRRNMSNYPGMMEAFDKAAAAPGVTPEILSNIEKDKLNVWGTSIKTGVSISQRLAPPEAGKPPAGAPVPADSVPILRQQAVDHYKTAILIEPDSVIGYHNLAIAYTQTGNLDGAVTALQQAAQKKPSVETYSYLADAYLRKADEAEKAKDTVVANSNYSGALAAMGQARRLDPANDQLLNTMIDLYTKLGRAEEAKPFIREGIAKDPTNKVYQYNLGVLLMQTDSLQESLPYFDAAIKSDPAFESALINAASVHMKLGDKMRKATQGSDSKKSDDKAYVEHFKSAAGYYEKLVEMKPDEANYWEYLASAYANAGMVSKAKTAIDKADSLKKK